MEFSKTVIILEEDGGGRKIGGEGIYKVLPPLAPALLGREERNSMHWIRRSVGCRVESFKPVSPPLDLSCSSISGE